MSLTHDDQRRASTHVRRRRSPHVVVRRRAVSRHQRLDLEDEATIAGAAEAVQADGGVLDLVLVASGILHDDEELRPEKTWRARWRCARAGLPRQRRRPGARGQALRAAAGARS
jgi:hypothetical protein